MTDTPPRRRVGAPSVRASSSSAATTPALNEWFRDE